MAPNRQETGARTPQPAAGQRQVGQREHVVHPVRVVREPHRPSENPSPRLEEHFGGGLDLGPRDSAGAQEFVPGGPFEVLKGLGPAAREAPDVVLVYAAPLVYSLQQRLEQRHVRADVGLQIEIGDRRTEQHAAPVRRDPEARQTELTQRVDDDDAAAAPPQLHELGDQPGVIARRIRARDQHQVRLLEILEHHGAGARSIDAREAHAGGVVAVEGAVVDVRGPVGPRHQLHQERGFVAGSARGVEEHLLRPGRPKGFGRDFQRRIPTDPAVSLLAVFRNEGEGDSAQAFEFGGGHRLQAAERKPCQRTFADGALHVAGLRLQ